MEPTLVPAAHLLCPNCGAFPSQRLDSRVADQTIAACVCTRGHLFVTQWEVVD